jgi:transposase-like protein
MEQKEEMARRLLSRGLSVSQVSLQLRCSKPFVRRIRNQLDEALETSR